MELAPDEDMNGLLGIEPANAEEARLPPAVAVPAVSAATAHATASDERRRDMQRTSTTQRRCPVPLRQSWSQRRHRNGRLRRARLREHSTATAAGARRRAR